MKAKYDIARLHKDCLAWCESPTWKPWMVEFGLKKVYDAGRIFIRAEFNVISISISKIQVELDVLIFAQFIGLDIEQYRLPEIDRDQAVRDYLAGIPEGAPLWEGSEWVKQTNEYGVGMKLDGGTYYFIHKNGQIDPLSYTFLRLDLKEDKR